MNVTITADVVAWYAAVVATGAFVVNAYNAWRDRARLVVSARSGYQVTPGPHPYSPDATYISITVANPGRRPATVERVWLTVRGKKGGLLAHDSLIGGARKLEEGTSTSYMVNQSELNLEDLESVCASDQSGRTWRGRIRHD